MKLYTYDLNLVLNKELKSEILNKKINRYINKGFNTKDATKRAKQEIMPKTKFAKYSKLAKFILSAYDLPATNIHLEMSTNRLGQHSWYIYVPVIVKNYWYRATDVKFDYCSYAVNYNTFVKIRISDHECISNDNVIDFNYLESIESVAKKLIVNNIIHKDKYYNNEVTYRPYVNMDYYSIDTEAFDKALEFVNLKGKDYINV